MATADAILCYLDAETRLEAVLGGETGIPIDDIDEALQALAEARTAVMALLWCLGEQQRDGVNLKRLNGH